jgi:hypothetical protein
LPPEYDEHDLVKLVKCEGKNAKGEPIWWWFIARAGEGAWWCPRHRQPLDSKQLMFQVTEPASEPDAVIAAQ